MFDNPAFLTAVGRAFVSDDTEPEKGQYAVTLGQLAMSSFKVHLCMTYFQKHVLMSFFIADYEKVERPRSCTSEGTF